MCTNLVGVDRTIPSWTPAPSFGGNSLFGLFNESIAENLAKFPQGPALSDKFWLYMLCVSPLRRRVFFVFFVFWF